jgi:hypothetical protein
VGIISHINQTETGFFLDGNVTGYKIIIACQFSNRVFHEKKK